MSGFNFAEFTKHDYPWSTISGRVLGDLSLYPAQYMVTPAHRG